MCSATHARRHITRRRRTSRTKCASRSAKAEHINQKNVFCPVDKRRFFAGAGSGGRTRTVSLPQDFESSTSANSIIPAMYGVCSHCADNGSIVSRFPAFVKGGNGDFLIEKRTVPQDSPLFLFQAVRKEPLHKIGVSAQRFKAAPEGQHAAVRRVLADVALE